MGRRGSGLDPATRLRHGDVLAVAEKVDEEGIGKKTWRKVLSFLKQLIDFDYAKLKNDYPRDRATP